MGACSVSEMRNGESAARVFEEIRETCIAEHGDNEYNGTFSTCDFCGITLRMPGAFTNANIRAATQYIYKHIDEVGKRNAYAIDMGISHYEIIKPRIIPVKSKPELRFFIASYGGKKENRTFKTLREAKEYVSGLVRDREDYFYIGKCYINEKGSDALFRAEFDTKIRKKKPARVPKGAVVKEIHAYYFYGMAAE